LREAKAWAWFVLQVTILTHRPPKFLSFFNIAHWAASWEIVGTMFLNIETSDEWGPMRRVVRGHEADGVRAGLGKACPF
jgi:hypothetical protein